MKRNGPYPLPTANRRANRINAFVGDTAYGGLRAECATSREMSETVDAAVTVYLSMPARERDARLTAARFNLRRQGGLG